MSGEVKARQCGSHQAGNVQARETKENIMKRFALTTMLAGTVLAGLLGSAGVAHADLSDVIYAQQQQHRAYVPHVDNTVRANTTIVRH